MNCAYNEYPNPDCSVCLKKNVQQVFGRKSHDYFGSLINGYKNSVIVSSPTDENSLQLTNEVLNPKVSILEFDSSDNNWKETHQFTSSTNGFGSSAIVINNRTIAIKNTEHYNNRKGIVYIYKQKENVINTIYWEKIQELISFYSENEHFGDKMQIYQNYLFCSSQNNTGSMERYVEIFKFDESTQEYKIHQIEKIGSFEIRSISNNFAFFKEYNYGDILVYHLDTSTEKWIFHQRIEAPNHEREFGKNVKVRSNFAIISASGCDHENIKEAGKVLVYELDQSNNSIGEWIYKTSFFFNKTIRK